MTEILLFDLNPINSLKYTEILQHLLTLLQCTVHYVLFSQHLLDLEQELMQEETQMPVYFAQEDEETLDIYQQVKAGLYSEQAGSAAEGRLLDHR